MVVVSVYGPRIRAGDLAGRLLVVDGKAVVHALLIRDTAADPSANNGNGGRLDSSHIII